MDLKTRSVTGQNINRREFDVRGVKLVVHELDDIDTKNLRTITDRIKDQEKINTIILIINKTAEKMSFVLGLTKDMVDVKKFDSRELGNKLAGLFDGSCGGRIDFVQGGSNKPVNDMAGIITRFVDLIK